MKEKLHFKSCKLPDFFPKMLLTHSEDPLTHATELNKPKLFSLMETCIDKIIFIQYFCNPIVKLL